jgi:hypothetical protein
VIAAANIGASDWRRARPRVQNVPDSIMRSS